MYPTKRYGKKVEEVVVVESSKVHAHPRYNTRNKNPLATDCTKVTNKLQCTKYTNVFMLRHIPFVFTYVRELQ